MSQAQNDPLLPTAALFRFALPCFHQRMDWKEGLKLPDRHLLLHPAGMDGRKVFAQVWAAWSEKGLGFCVRVQGKRQAPWCRDTQFDESDGLRVWVDTRNTQNIHRAGRFCHSFGFLPSGGGPRREDAVAGQLLINRAKEHPRPAPPSQMLVRGEKRVDGYVLEAFLQAGALTGFDPQEHAKLGFAYAVVDRELGEQTLTVGSEFPYREDPSLWSTLELVK